MNHPRAALPASIFETPPRAPTEAEWDALSEEERARVAEILHSHSEDEDFEAQPEGDPHREVCLLSESALREFYTRKGRRVYVGVNMWVRYPAARPFAPDLFVVLDAAPGPRMSWLVSAEKKGLDFVLEVVVAGDPTKDLVKNVARYASLGIPEYFVYDRPHNRLYGYRLPPGGDRYARILAQHGYYRSEVLDLELVLHDDQLHFYTASSRLMTAGDLRAQVERRFDEAMQRVLTLEQSLADEQQAREAQQAALEEAQRLREEEQRLREEEQRLREEEQRLREEEQRAREAAEQRLALALAELERLRGG